MSSPSAVIIALGAGVIIGAFAMLAFVVLFVRRNAEVTDAVIDKIVGEKPPP